MGRALTLSAALLAAVFAAGTAVGQTAVSSSEQVAGQGAAMAPEWLAAIAPAFDSVAADPGAWGVRVERFLAGVVRPSLEDCAVLYYGALLRPGYSPAPSGEAEMQRAIMADDHGAAFVMGMRILELAPANLTALYWTLHAATEAGMEWEVRNSLKGRYNSIAHLISLSGDGRSAAGALKVAWPGDMYTYAMIELGLDIGKGYLWDGRWTELEVTPRAGEVTKFRDKSIFFETWKGR
jgi:hypothetical protein